MKSNILKRVIQILMQRTSSGQVIAVPAVPPKAPPRKCTKASLSILFFSEHLTARVEPFLHKNMYYIRYTIKTISLKIRLKQRMIQHVL